MKMIVQLATLAILAQAGFSQQTQAPPVELESAGISFVSNSALVLVPVLVRSPDGELVTNLTEPDFRLTDNGVEQKLDVAPTADQQFALVVLMQTGGAAPRQFQNYRTFNLLLRSMMSNANHKVGLVTFDSQLRQIWNFPPRIDGLKNAFSSPEAGDIGAALMDALNCGIALLEQQPRSLRRVLLLFSQTQDSGSKVLPEALVGRLAESNTTVYSVAFPPETTTLPKVGFSVSRLPISAPDPQNRPEDLHEASMKLQENTAAEAATLTGENTLG